MSVCILEDKEQGYKCLYCTTTMWAFGGIFYKDENPQDFLEWLSMDARKYTDHELEGLMNKWRVEKED